MSRDLLKKYPELYGATLNARVAQDALNGAEPPHGCSRTEYAIYALSRAIEDIARGLIKMQEDK